MISRYYKIGLKIYPKVNERIQSKLKIALKHKKIFMSIESNSYKQHLVKIKTEKQKKKLLNHFDG